MRPACRDGDTSTAAAPQRPCSERAFGTADPPADLFPAAAAALGGGHEGGMEGGPAVEGDPVLVGVLAAGWPPQHLRRSCRAPARPWDATLPPALPPSPVLGGGAVWGDPGERSQLCLAWARRPFAVQEFNTQPWGSHAGAAGAACGHGGPMGSAKPGPGLLRAPAQITWGHRGLWVDGEDSQDRRRAALLTVLVQVQVVTWKDRRCRWRWQDPWDHARAGPRPVPRGCRRRICQQQSPRPQ